MSFVIHAAVVAYGLGLAFLATLALIFAIERWSRRSVLDESQSRHPERRRSDGSWLRRSEKRARSGTSSIPIITMSRTIEPVLRTTPLPAFASLDEFMALDLAGD